MAYENENETISNLFSLAVWGGLLSAGILGLNSLLEKVNENTLKEMAASAAQALNLPAYGKPVEEIVKLRDETGFYIGKGGKIVKGGISNIFGELPRMTPSEETKKEVKNVIDSILSKEQIKEKGYDIQYLEASNTIEISKRGVKSKSVRIPLFDVLMPESGGQNIVEAHTGKRVTLPLGRRGGNLYVLPTAVRPEDSAGILGEFESIFRNVKEVYGKAGQVSKGEIEAQVSNLMSKDRMKRYRLAVEKATRSNPLQAAKSYFSTVGEVIAEELERGTPLEEIPKVINRIFKAGFSSSERSSVVYVGSYGPQGGRVVTPDFPRLAHRVYDPVLRDIFDLSAKTAGGSPELKSALDEIIQRTLLLGSYPAVTVFGSKAESMLSGFTYYSDYVKGIRFNSPYGTSSFEEFSRFIGFAKDPFKQAYQFVNPASPPSAPAIRNPFYGGSLYGGAEYAMPALFITEKQARRGPLAAILRNNPRLMSTAQGTIIVPWGMKDTGLFDRYNLDVKIPRTIKGGRFIDTVVPEGTEGVASGNFDLIDVVTGKVKEGTKAVTFEEGLEFLEKGEAYLRARGKVNLVSRMGSSDELHTIRLSKKDIIFGASTFTEAGEEMVSLQVGRMESEIGAIQVGSKGGTGLSLSRNLTKKLNKALKSVGASRYSGPMFVFMGIGGRPPEDLVAGSIIKAMALFEAFGGSEEYVRENWEKTRGRLVETAEAAIRRGQETKKVTRIVKGVETVVEEPIGLTIRGLNERLLNVIGGKTILERARKHRGEQSYLGNLAELAFVPGAIYLPAAARSVFATPVTALKKSFNMIDLATFAASGRTTLLERIGEIGKMQGVSGKVARSVGYLGLSSGQKIDAEGLGLGKIEFKNLDRETRQKIASAYRRYARSGSGNRVDAFNEFVKIWQKAFGEKDVLLDLGEDVSLKLGGIRFREGTRHLVLPALSSIGLNRTTALIGGNSFLSAAVRLLEQGVGEETASAYFSELVGLYAGELSNTVFSRPFTSKKLGLVRKWYPGITPAEVPMREGARLEQILSDAFFVEVNTKEGMDILSRLLPREEKKKLYALFKESREKGIAAANEKLGQLVVHSVRYPNVFTTSFMPVTLRINPEMKKGEKLRISGPLAIGSKGDFDNDQIMLFIDSMKGKNEEDIARLIKESKEVQKFALAWVLADPGDPGSEFNIALKAVLAGSATEEQTKMIYERMNNLQRTIESDIAKGIDLGFSKDLENYSNLDKEAQEKIRAKLSDKLKEKRMVGITTNKVTDLRQGISNIFRVKESSPKITTNFGNALGNVLGAFVELTLAKGGQKGSEATKIVSAFLNDYFDRNSKVENHEKWIESFKRLIDIDIPAKRLAAGSELSSEKEVSIINQMMLAFEALGQPQKKEEAVETLIGVLRDAREEVWRVSSERTGTERHTQLYKYYALKRYMREAGVAMSKEEKGEIRARVLSSLLDSDSLVPDKLAEDLYPQIELEFENLMEKLTEEEKMDFARSYSEGLSGQYKKAASKLFATSDGKTSIFKVLAATAAAGIATAALINIFRENEVSYTPEQAAMSRPYHAPVNPTMGRPTYAVMPSHMRKTYSPYGARKTGYNIETQDVLVNGTFNNGSISFTTANRLGSGLEEW